MANNLAIQAKAQEVNTTVKFDSDLHNLLNLLGKTDVEVVAPGSAFRIYKTSGTLADGTVAPKALIPDSGVAVDDGTIVEISFKKYRNLVPIEDIAKKGYNTAVGGSNARLVRLAQGKLRKSIFDGLDVEGVGKDTAATFKKKLAKAAAYIAKKYEDEAVTPVFFVNTDDAFEYLGDADVTVQNTFGISYLENFMGLGNAILDSNIPAGTVFGTACENIDVLAASVSAIDGLEMTTDESNCIAVHVAPAYSNGSIETVLYSGVQALPVIADCVVKVTSAA